MSREQPALNTRLSSLDAFRGFTIAAMLLVNNPGDWGAVYAPLAHAHWHGWTFTDTIFPSFVFISGLSMALSLGQRAQRGDDPAMLMRQSARRAAIIIALGVALNLIPALSWSELRLPGVLQRLGLCSLLCAPLVIWCGWRWQALCGVALLALYSVLMLCVPVPDASGVWHRGALTPGADTGAWLDRALLDGHLWQLSKTWDPEGILSTLPALASQLAGVLAGHWLATPSRTPMLKAVVLVLVGLFCMVLGHGLDLWFMPINKSLWTPSYVVLMAGWSMVVFGALYGVLDAMESGFAAGPPQGETAPSGGREPHAVGDRGGDVWRARLVVLARPLTVFGMNAVFIYVLAELLAKFLMATPFGTGESLKAWLYRPIQAMGLAPADTSLLYALGFVGVMGAVAWAMWRKRIFIKV